MASATVSNRGTEQRVLRMKRDKEAAAVGGGN